MNRGFLFSLLILGTLACGGCKTFKEEELQVIRGCRVSPAVYRKLVQREVVTPPDIVELWHKRVPSPLIEKQLDEVGVDYAVRKSDVALLEGAGVGAAVIESLRSASDRYVSRYAPPEFFEANNLDSDDYLVSPPVRRSSSLLWGREILQR